MTHEKDSPHDPAIVVSELLKILLDILPLFSNLIKTGDFFIDYGTNSLC